jgi:phosphoketolase
MSIRTRSTEDAPLSVARERTRKESLVPARLSPDLLQKMHAYWRAANYLSVGQIYLQDNPLLGRPHGDRKCKTKFC